MKTTKKHDFDQIFKIVLSNNGGKIKQARTVLTDCLLHCISKKNYSEDSILLFFNKIKEYMRDVNYLAVLESSDCDRRVLYLTICREIKASSKIADSYMERNLFFYEKSNLKRISKKELQNLYYLIENILKYDLCKYFSRRRIDDLNARIAQQMKYQQMKSISLNKDDSKDYLSLKTNYNYHIK